MNKTSGEKNFDRRSFLQRIGWGAGAVGLAGAALSAAQSTAKAGDADNKPTAGYRETDHVLRAYQAARF